METIGQVLISHNKDSTTKCLNALLADHYILMNITMQLLMEEREELFEKKLELTYTELKSSIIKIVEYGRSNQANLSLSINSVLYHTRLQTNTSFKNIQLCVEHLIQDYRLTSKNSKEDYMRCENDKLEAQLLFISITTILNNNQVILQECLTDIPSKIVKSKQRAPLIIV